ncbi:MAG: 50S ribosomal protein L35 [Spirochaetes bacterium]|nr:50S ribosomal protein L35 [Spirochaetota bacterium]
MKNKMKSSSAAKKRFKVTGSGKVKFRHACGRHNLGKVKGTNTKRKYRKKALVHDSNRHEIDRLLPYSR